MAGFELWRSQPFVPPGEIEEMAACLLRSWLGLVGRLAVDAGAAVGRNYAVKSRLW